MQVPMHRLQRWKNCLTSAEVQVPIQKLQRRRSSIGDAEVQVPCLSYKDGGAAQECRGAGSRAKDIDEEKQRRKSTGYRCSSTSSRN